MILLKFLPDQRYNEFLAEKISYETESEIILSFAATDFSGQVQAPALLWLKYALVAQADIEHYNIPEPTRWDEIQNSNFKNSELANILPYIEQDVGQRAPDTFNVPNRLKLSPSQLEKYQQCPFIFSAEKIFRLSDLPDVDLDVDAMTSGRLLHAV